MFHCSFVFQDSYVSTKIVQLLISLSLNPSPFRPSLPFPILYTDPYHSSCLPLHIAVLVELKKSNDLFYLAHNLVDVYPGKAVAWFAVGCYYMLVNKHETARRFLSKATSLDRVYGPAWLAFGHSFAAENEHDQAMAAYFTASQV